MDSTFENVSEESGDVSEKIPPPMTGVEVAVQIERFFDALPIELAATLVDSNVVLTMSGYKPHTELFIDVPSEQDLENVKSGVETLNTFLRGAGLDIKFE